MVASVGKYTTIGVSKYVRDRLDELRRHLGAKNWDEFFEKMLEIYQSWFDMVVEHEVRQVLCDEYSEARATLPGWSKIFSARFGDPDRIAVAFKYIKPAQDGEYYVVDKEMCGGGSK